MNQKQMEDLAAEIARTEFNPTYLYCELLEIIQKHNMNQNQNNTQGILAAANELNGRILEWGYIGPSPVVEQISFVIAQHCIGKEIMQQARESWANQSDQAKLHAYQQGFIDGKIDAPSHEELDHWMTDKLAEKDNEIAIQKGLAETWMHAVDNRDKSLVEKEGLLNDKDNTIASARVVLSSFKEQRIHLTRIYNELSLRYTDAVDELKTAKAKIVEMQDIAREALSGD